MSPEQLYQLAQRWYDDRLDRDWRRKTISERREVLDQVGLTGPFWKLE